MPRCRRRRQPNIAHLQPTTETNTEMHLIRTSRNNCNAHWQHDEYRISLAARMPMQSGDSLVVVIIFPLATMLTFTSAVGKLTIRVLGQHHSLLQVISQSYCQVFVKSYNFVFEKINIEYAPYQKWQKTRSSVHIHCI